MTNLAWREGKRSRIDVCQLLESCQIFSLILFLPSQGHLVIEMPSGHADTGMELFDGYSPWTLQPHDVPGACANPIPKHFEA